MFDLILEAEIVYLCFYFLSIKLLCENYLCNYGKQYPLHIRNISVCNVGVNHEGSFQNFFRVALNFSKSVVIL
jgi:hypothetical protein